MSARLRIGSARGAAAPTLPLDIVTSATAILGQRGTGKTNAAGVIVEEVVRAGAHVAVLDPVGAWWGITRKGTRAGLRGIVLGGEHGDVPLEETAGALVARLVLDRHWPVVVVDMKLLRKGAQLRFMADYLEALYDANRLPLLQVFEEAHRALPQDRSNFSPTAGRVLGAGEDIVTLGRSRGLGALLVTQRAARLNKNVLESCELLILLRLMGENDRKTAKAWVEAAGDASRWRPVLDTIATFTTGDAWLWGMGLLERVRFRPRSTFDSSYTPTVGEAAPTTDAPRAPVDLDELRAAMAETVERAKANDPKALRERIAELERQVADLPDAEPERVEVPVLAPDALGRMRAAVADIEERVAGAWLDHEQQVERTVERLRAPWDAAAAVVREEAQRVTEQLQRVGASAPVGRRVSPASPDRAIAPPAAERAAANGASGSVSGAQRRILNALAWLATVGMEPASRLQVAMVAGYHERTKGFTNGLGSLRSGGLIDYPQPGMIQLEAEGRARAEAPSAPLTDDEMQRMIYRQVGGARERILRAVLAVHPGSITRAELAAGLGYHERTKGFTNALGSLRSLGLIEYPMPGYVAVTEAMFARRDREAA